MVNSLSSEQGECTVHGRLRYADRRDDNRATRFAELRNVVSRLHLVEIGWDVPYAKTASLMFDKTATSSLIRCGLLSVLSSCSITPTTISS